MKIKLNKIDWLEVSKSQWKGTVNGVKVCVLEKCDPKATKGYYIVESFGSSSHHSDANTFEDASRHAHRFVRDAMFKHFFSQK